MTHLVICRHSMTSVEGTNDFSIVSKLSAASAGYFEDDFLTEFVEKKRRRAGLINWGYYIRYKSLESSFENIVHTLCERKDRKFQILSIGAGFDTTFFTTKHKTKTDNFVFYEIDLPSNVSRKSKLIERSERCLKMLKNPSFSPDGIVDENFILFACDLADQKKLNTSLLNYKFDFNLPTVILSECVITYMEEKDSTNLIKFLASKLPHASFIVYEQIRPSDGFGQFMVEHFKTIGSPIKGVHKYFDTKRQARRYKDCGWQECRTKTLTEVWNSFDKEEINRIKSLEQFDEYEEFLLKTSHYLVVCASNGEMVALSPFPDDQQPLPSPQQSTIMGEKAPVVELARFGHCSVQLGDRVFVFGGFGVLDGLHRRLPQMLTLDLSSSSVTRHLTEDPVFSRVFSSAALDEPRQKVYLSGGRASPADSREDVVEVEVETGRWRRTDWRLGGGRWRHCSAVLAGHLLILGGCGGSSVLALDLQSQHWLPPLLLEREVVSASCVVWAQAGVLLWSGGLEELRPTSTVRKVGIRNGQISLTNLGLEISARFSHSSHILGDNLIICGGVGPGDPPPCEIIDLITGARRLVSLPARVEGDLQLYHAHSSITRDRRLILLAGGGNCFSFGTHYNSSVQFDLTEFLT